MKNHNCRIVEVGGKINLYLEILHRRPDGYHELRTLFYPLPGPKDILRIQPGSPGSGLSFTCSEPALENPGNLVVRAWEAFSQASGLRLDLAVHLEKHIPMAAGLGGGSADAGAMLRLLNFFAVDKALPASALTATAVKLGADVPFFLQDSPAWATGIGEMLQPAEVDLSGMTLVLLCPAVSIPTNEAYGLWDKLVETGQFRKSFLLTEYDELDKISFSFGDALFFNSFEQAIFPAYPELRRLKERCLMLGASGALLSGSGSSLFALFRNGGSAKAAVEMLQGEAADIYVHSL